VHIALGSRYEKGGVLKKRSEFPRGIKGTDLEIQGFPRTGPKSQRSEWGEREEGRQSVGGDGRRKPGFTGSENKPVKTNKASEN